MAFNPNALLILGLAAIQILASTSYVFAADRHVKSFRAHHKIAKVVADYDGTPIFLRCTDSSEVHNYDGPYVFHDVCDAYPVVDTYNPKMGPMPRRYLNGQLIYR